MTPAERVAAARRRRAKAEWERACAEGVTPLWDAILRGDGLPKEPRQTTRRTLSADPTMDGGTLAKPDGRRPINEYEALMQLDCFEEPVVSVEETLLSTEYIAGMVESLPEPERTVVTEIVFGALSLQQVADSTGISKSTVRVIRDRALRMMRDMIENGTEK